MLKSRLCDEHALQGSQHENVRLNCIRFKPKRNLLYTGATRAKKRLLIRGIKNPDDLRVKMELHPKSIVWQLGLGDKFEHSRVEAALREA